jgi:hypothetical protein
MPWERAKWLTFFRPKEGGINEDGNGRIIIGGGPFPTASTANFLEHFLQIYACIAKMKSKHY